MTTFTGTQTLAACTPDLSTIATDLLETTSSSQFGNGSTATTITQAAVLLMGCVFQVEPHPRLFVVDANTEVV